MRRISFPKFIFIAIHNICDIVIECFLFMVTSFAIGVVDVAIVDITHMSWLPNHSSIIFARRRSPGFPSVCSSLVFADVVIDNISNKLAAVVSFSFWCFQEFLCSLYFSHLELTLYLLDQYIGIKLLVILVTSICYIQSVTLN